MTDPTILFYQDISLWNTEFHKLHNLQALKVARDIADPRRIYYNFYLKAGPYRFDPTKSHVLYGRGNSGVLATQLAVSLGCRPIILLGCDCKCAENGDTDFYGVNEFWTSSTLQQCAFGLEFLKECPVPIISCSTNDFFSYRPLHEVLDSLKHERKSRQYYVKKLTQKQNII